MRRILIVGCYPTGLRMNARPGDEVWSLNECAGDLEVDRLYELHHPEDRPWRKPEHWENLKAAENVWAFYPHLIGPQAHQYPVMEILNWAPRRYFTSSLAWMLAHAAYEHAWGRPVAAVELWGMHFASPHEQFFERPCVEWWAGWLQGRGIDVLVPPSCPLMQGTYLYGLQQVSAAHETFYRSTRYWADSNYLIDSDLILRPDSMDE